MGFGTLIQRITYHISGRSTASSGLYTPTAEMFDYALGGVPFLSATNDTRPDTEKPVQQRKQQFDNFKDPGEYSLNQWWLRAQHSYIGGAGVIYEDPDTAGVSSGTSINVRFNRSIGVDPFTTPGSLSLLNEVNQSVNYTSTAAIQVASYPGPGFNDPRVWIVSNDNKVTSASMGAGDVSASFQRAVTGVGTQSIVSNVITYDLALSNPEMFVMTNGNDAQLGGLWKVLDNNASLVATRIYNAPPPLNIRFSMVNSRGFIYAGRANQLWQLNPLASAGTSWPASPVAVVPSDQTISCVSDGPDGIYVSANSDSSGYIYKTTFDNSGVVNGLTQVAIMPNGEFINQIASYVATYMIITTTTTVRVAEFTGGGLTYGPPLVTVSPEKIPPYSNLGDGAVGFGAIAFYGRKAFIGTQTDSTRSLHDGAQGIVCLDLGTLLTDLNTGTPFNPYCTWVYNPSTVNRVYSITTDPLGRIFYTTNTLSSGTTGQLWIQHATNLISTGYLDTGRVRFNTVEPKLYKYFSVRTPSPLAGNLSVSVLGDDNSVTSYVTYGPTADPGTSDIPTPVPIGPRNWEALRFTLNRNPSVLSTGAILNSWQIKALPGTLKQRMIVRQFLCFNSMKDKSGQQISGDTLALDQLTAVRQMCQRGDTVTLQDLVNNISDQVIIDDYQFTMLAAPGPNSENYGGYLTVTMRTVADAVPPISLAGSGGGD